jgi:hypothetical protein
MCETAAQDQLQDEQIQAYQQAQQMTQQQYQHQQDIYAPMAKQFQSIFDRGPNMEGFSEEQKQDLEATAVDGTARNYAGAARALNEEFAARGGGNIPLTPGGEIDAKEDLAASSAAEESREESSIKQADYTQGYNEWQAAGSGLESIAAGENPIGYENASTNSGSAASTTADAIAKEQNGWESAALGAVGQVAGAWVGA